MGSITVESTIYKCTDMERFTQKDANEWRDTEEEAIKNRLLREIEVYGKLVSSENKKYEYLINHSSTEGEV